MATFLKLFIRRFERRPFSSILSLLSLVIGMILSLVAFLWFQYELGYDNFHSDSSSIYRLLYQEGKNPKSPYVFVPIAEKLKDECPGVKYATFLKFEDLAPLSYGNKTIKILPAYTNDDFFSIFDGFEFVQGNGTNVFKTEQSVVLNEDVAKKLFGEESALGKIVTVDSEGESYVVTGVVRLSSQTHLNFGMITLVRFHPFLGEYFNDNWERSEITTAYVKLVANADKDAVLERIRQALFYSKEGKAELLTQPVSDIHLYTDYVPALNDQNISNIRHIWGLGGLAIFILLSTVLNFAIIFLVRSIKYSKQFGINQMSGASHQIIIFHFVSEAILILSFAAIISFCIVGWNLSYIGSWFHKSIVLHFSGWGVLAVIAFIVVCGLLIGLYTFKNYLTRKLVERLSSKNSIHSNKHFFKALVVAQFFIAIVFVCSSLIFKRQQECLGNKDLGFNSQNVLVLDLSVSDDISLLKRELLKNPSVLAVSASIAAPIDFVSRGKIGLHDSTDSIEMSFFWTDEDFQQVYQIQMDAGRFLSSEDSTPFIEFENKTKAEANGINYSESIPIVLNETAAKQLGLQNPVGQRVQNYIVVGVVNDFNFESLYHPMTPLIIEKEPRIANRVLNIRISSLNETSTIGWISDEYKRLTNNSIAYSRLFRDIIEEKYQHENDLSKLVGLLSVVVILISALGIFAFSAFVIEEKTKEIGIRKINGAKVFEILAMLNDEFVRWVIIAFVIACPVAYYAMSNWLENFAYKTTLDWWIFALAGLLALGIALLTVSYQSYKAAVRNPIESLRYE